MIKVAMVGLGGMGSTHYNLYRGMDDVELTAVVDVEPERARAKAVESSARWYTEMEAMLDAEAPELVDIATPTYTHADLAIQALSRGIPVICEKPAALCPEDVARVYRCAREHGVPFMAAHVLRFWPEYQWLTAAVQEKRYGVLKHMNLWRGGEKPRTSWQNWMLTESKSGLVPYDLHIHDVDFMVYLFGMPSDVDAYMVHDGEITNYIRSTYRYPAGLEVSAEAGWYSGKQPFTMGFEALFEQGYASFRDEKLVWYPNDSEPVPVSAEACMEIGSGLSEINVSNTSGYYNEIRYFMDCIRHGSQPDIVKEKELVDTLRLIKREVEIAGSK